MTNATQFAPSQTAQAMPRSRSATFNFRSSEIRQMTKKFEEMFLIAPYAAQNTYSTCLLSMV